MSTEQAIEIDSFVGKSHQTVGFVYWGTDGADNYKERRNRFLESVNRPNTMKVDVVYWNRSGASMDKTQIPTEDPAKRIDHVMTKLRLWAQKQGYVVHVFFMP